MNKFEKPKIYPSKEKEMLKNQGYSLLLENGWSNGGLASLYNVS